MHITEVFLLCSVEWDVTVQGFSWLDDLPFPIQANCYSALKAGAAQKLHLYHQKYSQVVLTDIVAALITKCVDHCKSLPRSAYEAEP